MRTCPRVSLRLPSVRTDVAALTHITFHEDSLSGPRMSRTAPNKVTPAPTALNCESDSILGRDFRDILYPLGLPVLFQSSSSRIWCDPFRGKQTQALT
jgi:hypothetical protein